MGETRIKDRNAAEKGAVQHLREALETEDGDEKGFHIKQTLQLLDVDAADN